MIDEKYKNLSLTEDMKKYFSEVDSGFDGKNIETLDTDILDGMLMAEDVAKTYMENITSQERVNV